MKKYVSLFMFCCMLSLSACATVQSGINMVSSQEIIASNPTEGMTTFILSNRVVRGDQVVMVHPNRNLTESPSALFVPFGLSQEANQAEIMSEGLSRIIWQQFLSEKVFPILEFSNTPPPYKVTDALSLAKAKNADFLVGGYITYYFNGAQFANTRISLILEIYDVANGNLLWSIAHAGEMPFEHVRDYILFKVKTAMPFDPSYTVTATLANDMARLIKMWTTHEPEAQNDSQRRAF